ncbi:hypothetical protein GUITHDRAFT_135684 [Guillardia theta CCMP2712]|uniref:Dynactin subunit 5 n=1 Tax=Guillardia theta (strain CCMP2712) TaxID=905079 RepID=L1JPL5_GUITC|nr:hypothetical protein GUITHDRAFT_135684 [Guillardia theta CCMP2712]EKX50008.1 hypothetical protein GUITHDRAFT_135684 [Guillardia theta CCMP2712]|mmetsp:Transcript_7907/g.26421  ORF Transcript_7907/g.26421 Transcript_7907/m.26421 type:complete len:178 (-) Transcript_7907:1810-2343(-)|eukprot:XP_005836988.1 hypothetical protein GUITHDRAFT_135684 [Guillardia theta CCMP2712]
MQGEKDSEYLQGSQGTKFSVGAFLYGAHNISLGAKTVIESDTILRGDMAKIKIGRHCVIKPHAVLRPSFKKSKSGSSFFPMTIGNNTSIGRGSVVEALKVGSCVDIGANCIIGKRAILSDCCKIDDGTVIPPDTVVPPFARMRGIPGHIYDELPETFEGMMHQATFEYIFEVSKRSD